MAELSFSTFANTTRTSRTAQVFSSRLAVYAWQHEVATVAQINTMEESPLADEDGETTTNEATMLLNAVVEVGEQ